MLERFTWFKQSAYCYRGDGVTIYIDPWGIPKEDVADVVFITHAHFDHYNPDLEKVRGPKTRIVAPADVARELSGDVTPVKPGQKLHVGGVAVETVPAYNIRRSRRRWPSSRSVAPTLWTCQRRSPWSARCRLSWRCPCITGTWSGR